ncbi:UNVERIFIED_CONTAM: Na+/H+ exchanger NHE1 [Hammondia hammondi]|eukprot:XP_008883086.1 Na+/H+ exchanger NHE1 [Hammondia hammondi]
MGTEKSRRLPAGREGPASPLLVQYKEISTWSGRNEETEGKEEEAELGYWRVDDETRAARDEESPPLSPLPPSACDTHHSARLDVTKETDPFPRAAWASLPSGASACSVSSDAGDTSLPPRGGGAAASQGSAGVAATAVARPGGASFRRRQPCGSEKGDPDESGNAADYDNDTERTAKWRKALRKSSDKGETKNALALLGAPSASRDSAGWRSSEPSRSWASPKKTEFSVARACLPLTALLLLIFSSLLFKAMPNYLGRPIERSHAGFGSAAQQVLAKLVYHSVKPSFSASDFSPEGLPASFAVPHHSSAPRRLAAETGKETTAPVSGAGSVPGPRCDEPPSEENPIASTLSFFCFLFFAAVFLQWLVSKIPSYPPPVSVVWFVFGMVAYGVASMPALLPPQTQEKRGAEATEGMDGHARAAESNTGIGDVPLIGHNLLQTGILEMRVIDSNVVYFVLVPILLYEATQSINWHKFKRFLAGGLLLAVLGVAVQVGILGVMFYYTYMQQYVPNTADSDQSPLTAAFLLASTLSSTDPVAVLSVLNAVNASDKLCTMFDGESLINDGSAVLLFQFFFYLLQGFSETPLSTFIMFMKLLFAGPALGCFLGFLVYLWLNCFRKYPMTQCLAIITVCYIAYFVAEVAFSLSGPLTAVCCGLFIKSYGHIALDREAQHKHHTLVEGLGLMANCAIFIISGIVTYGMMSSVFHRSDGGTYWLHLFLTYIYLNVARIFMIALFSPFLRRTGYGLSWKEAILLFWGGLRGGIVLALGLRIERDGNLESELTKALSFFISGSVFLILVIHGMTFELLYRWLNPYPPKPFRRVYLEAVMKMIDYQYMEEKQALNNHWLFNGTDVLVYADKVVPALGWRKVDRLGNLNLKAPDISVALSCLHEASFNTWVVPTAYSTGPAMTVVKRMATATVLPPETRATLALEQGEAQREEAEKREDEKERVGALRAAFSMALDQVRDGDRAGGVRELPETAYGSSSADPRLLSPASSALGLARDNALGSACLGRGLSRSGGENSMFLAPPGSNASILLTPQSAAPDGSHAGGDSDRDVDKRVAVRAAADERDPKGVAEGLPTTFLGSRDVERGAESAQLSPRYSVKSQALPVETETNQSPVLSQAPSIVFHSQPVGHVDGGLSHRPSMIGPRHREPGTASGETDARLKNYHKEKQAHTLAALSQGLKPELGVGIGVGSTFDPKFNLRLIEHATTMGRMEGNLRENGKTGEEPVAAASSSRRRKARGLRLHSRREADESEKKANSTDSSSSGSETDGLDNKPVEVIVEGEDPQTKLPVYRLTSMRTPRLTFDTDGRGAPAHRRDEGDSDPEAAGDWRDSRHHAGPAGWANALLDTVRFRRMRPHTVIDSGVGEGTRSPVLSRGHTSVLHSRRRRHQEDEAEEPGAWEKKARAGGRLAMPLVIPAKRKAMSVLRRGGDESPRTLAKKKEGKDVGDDGSTSGEGLLSTRKKVENGNQGAADEAGEEDDVLQDFPRYSDEDGSDDGRVPTRFDTDATLVFHHKDLVPGIERQKSKRKGVTQRMQSLLHLPHRSRRGSDASRMNMLSPPVSPRPGHTGENELPPGASSSPAALAALEGVKSEKERKERDEAYTPASVTPPSAIRSPDSAAGGSAAPESGEEGRGPLSLLAKSVGKRQDGDLEKDRGQAGGHLGIPRTSTFRQTSAKSASAGAADGDASGDQGEGRVPPLVLPADNGRKAPSRDLSEGSGRRGSAGAAPRRTVWSRKSRHGDKEKRILIRGRRPVLRGQKDRERSKSTDFDASHRSPSDTGAIGGRDTRSEGAQSADEGNRLADLKRSLSLGSSESYFEIPATPRRGSALSPDRGGREVRTMSPRMTQRAGSRRKVLRKEREGELYLMIFNACREMYHRLYHKHCIGGSALLSLNTSLDLSNDFAVGKVRQNPIRAWAEVLQEDEHGAGEAGGKRGPKKRTLQTLTGFEYEWSVLQSRLHCMQEQQQGWCGLRAAPFCCGRRVPSAFMRSLLNSGACQSDLEQILAFVDVHEELLEKGGKNMQQLMGEELLASYNRQILSAKRFVLYIRDCYPDSFRVAICKIAATLLLNLKTKLVKDTAQKGLVLEEDKEKLLRILDEQQFRLSRFRPCFIFIRPQSCMPSAMGHVLAFGARSHSASSSSGATFSRGGRDLRTLRSTSSDGAPEKGEDADQTCNDAYDGWAGAEDEAGHGVMHRDFQEQSPRFAGAKALPSLWEGRDNQDDERRASADRRTFSSVVRMMDSGRHGQYPPFDGGSQSFADGCDGRELDVSEVQVLVTQASFQNAV